MSSSKKSGGGGGSSSGGGFQALNLSPPIYAGIKKLGYRTPTPVQRKSLPILLTGSDAVVMARTGSECILYIIAFFYVWHCLLTLFAMFAHIFSYHMLTFLYHIL